MIYKINILQTKVELYKLILSDKKHYQEIFVKQINLKFKFNRSEILVYQKFDELINIFNDLLSDFLIDISQLYITLPNNFLIIEKSNNVDFYINKNSEMISWEMKRILLEDTSVYRYGLIPNTLAGEVIIAIVRKEVIDYFDKLLKMLNGNLPKILIGTNYSIDNNQKSLIICDQQIASNEADCCKDFAPSINKKKYNKKWIIICFIMIIIPFTVYWLMPIIQQNTSVITSVKVEPLQKDTIKSINSLPAKNYKDTIKAKPTTEIKVIPNILLDIIENCNWQEIENMVFLGNKLFIKSKSQPMLPNITYIKKSLNNEIFQYEIPNKYRKIQNKEFISNVSKKYLMFQNKQQMFNFIKENFSKNIPVQIIISKRNNQYFVVAI